MRRKIIPYNPKLKELARQLRNNSTYSEVLLWNRLKGGQMLGYDFHRQKPLYNYIVDFFCNALMLAIEVDGFTHNSENYRNDTERQKELERAGICFLRFSDQEVKEDVENVLRVIEFWILEHEDELDV